MIACLALLCLVSPVRRGLFVRAPQRYGPAVNPGGTLPAKLDLSAFRRMGEATVIVGTTAFAFDDSLWQGRKIDEEERLYDAAMRGDAGAAVVASFERTAADLAHMASAPARTAHFIAERVFVLERSGDTARATLRAPLDQAPPPIAIGNPNAVVPFRVPEMRDSPWVQFPTAYRFRDFGPRWETATSSFEGRKQAIALVEEHLDRFMTRRAALRERIASSLDELALHNVLGTRAGALKPNVLRKLELAARTADPPRPSAWVRGATVASVTTHVLLEDRLENGKAVEMTLP